MISDRFKFRPDPQWSHTGTLARGSRVAAVRWAGDAPLASPAEGPRWGVGWTLDGTLRLHAQWPGAVRLVLLWPGAAIRVVTAPQVVYLSARLGFTLRDDGQDNITYVMKP